MEMHATIIKSAYGFILLKSRNPANLQSVAATLMSFTQNGTPPNLDTFTLPDESDASMRVDIIPLG